MQVITLSATLLVLTSLAGCAVEPWVKPYERAKLADPIMSFSRNPVADSYLNHVYQAREAARGAEVGQGGGCGCN
ncbi:MAG: DUF4266 domain-containing protein [gamma proteobacterium endosymbiont of Lamellibrachia anaximandri]|nr:DUF4266 domain-containing protein [gamma proteobacterium endosymbiont of Lamellibrachia anaximandri]MBL3616560.1 DUF4266 domain-containing protein [gamma proteobacterium endosymbiont of Lamellibrachia anaximandri]